MTATINNFITALQFSTQYFENLTTIKPTLDQQGRPIVNRTKHFADATVEWDGRRYMLSLPLTPEASSMAQKVAVRLHQRRSKVLLEYRVMPAELCCIGDNGATQFSDILLAELPAEATPLSEAIVRLDGAKLLDAVARLEGEFDRLGMQHANLKLDNIMIDKEYNLYPLRMHYAAFDGADAAEFETLRREISLAIKIDPPLSNDIDHVEYEPQNALYGYKSVGNPFEGMCVAESAAGYGYIDTEGNELIEPQFIWAGDMREGRAEVETSEGMGLIDAKGNYILEPRYQIVDFDVDTAEIRAKLNERWSVYDYNGELLRTEDIEATK